MCSKSGRPIFPWGGGGGITCRPLNWRSQVWAKWEQTFQKNIWARSNPAKLLTRGGAAPDVADDADEPKGVGQVAALWKRGDGGLQK